MLNEASARLCNRFPTESAFRVLARKRLEVFQTVVSRNSPAGACCDFDQDLLGTRLPFGVVSGCHRILLPGSVYWRKTNQTEEAKGRWHLKRLVSQIYCMMAVNLKGVYLFG